MEKISKIIEIDNEEIIKELKNNKRITDRVTLPFEMIEEIIIKAINDRIDFTSISVYSAEPPIKGSTHEDKVVSEGRVEIFYDENQYQKFEYSISIGRKKSQNNSEEDYEYIYDSVEVCLNSMSSN